MAHGRLARLARSAATALVVVVGFVATTGARPAWALDKQGSAHGGAVDVDPDGFDMSGALTLGVSLVNHSYAARPDNTGLTLMRYAGHADVDLVGQHLSIPLDVNMFTDRLRAGAAKFATSELDVIGGVTTTWATGPGAVELGARLESDQPTDRPGATQFYGDVRARYLYSLARYWPALADALRDGDVSGWATLGWFTYNRSYFARPDNTGLALFRYELHAELSTFGDLVSLGLDATMFTDRLAGNPLGPSELDFTPEIIVHKGDFELHIAWESDRPVDRGGLEQQYVYALGVWNFDLVTDKTQPFETRGRILSP
jgi:hypothetical protein